MKNRFISLVSSLCVMVIISLTFTYTRLTECTHTVTVTDKYQNLVTTTGGTFVVQDTIMYSQFGSSNILDSIEVGSTYNITTTGIHIEWFSMYKNIIHLEKVE